MLISQVLMFLFCSKFEDPETYMHTKISKDMQADLFYCIFVKFLFPYLS